MNKKSHSVVRDRYAKWYDYYIYYYEALVEFIQINIPVNPLNGYIMYKLRYFLLHEVALDTQETGERTFHKNL